MSTRIYVNLPIADLQKSIAFFTALAHGADLKR